MTLVPDGYMAQTKTEFDPRFSENGCIPFTTQQIDALCEMYSAENSVESIADVYGVSKSTVTNILKKVGVDIRPRGRTRHVTPQVIEDALAARALGADWPEVQAMLGVRWEAMALNVRNERKAQVEALEVARCEAERSRSEVERLNRLVNDLRTSCSDLGRQLHEAKGNVAAGQRALSWLMHNRTISLDGVPGWLLYRLKRLINFEDKELT